MAPAPRFPSEAGFPPPISVALIDDGSVEIPETTRELARATLEDIMDRELQWLVYEANTSHTRTQLVTNLRGILTTLWVTDGLKGDTAHDAFFIRCDPTTMTQRDLDHGLVICEVGMAPHVPGQFVRFRIRITLRSHA